MYNLSSIYKDIFEPVESELKIYKEDRFVLCPELWNKFKFNDLPNIDFTKWKVLKLLNETGDFSEELSTISNLVGGIYIYAIMPNVIPVCGSYIMYIGRALKTEHENLRRRIKSYRNELRDDSKRERVHELFRLWGNYIYVFYLPISSDNKTIGELETRLIGALLPPCNADIQAESVKGKVRAFSR